MSSLRTQSVVLISWSRSDRPLHVPPLTASGGRGGEDVGVEEGRVLDPRRRPHTNTCMHACVLDRVVSMARGRERGRERGVHEGEQKPSGSSGSGSGSGTASMQADLLRVKVCH